MKPETIRKLKELKMFVFLDLPFLSLDKNVYYKFLDPYWFKYLAPNFSCITICGPTRIVGNSKIDINKYRIIEGINLNFYGLPYWDGFIDFLKKFILIFIPLIKTLFFKNSLHLSSVFWYLSIKP